MYVDNTVADSVRCIVSYWYNTIVDITTHAGIDGYYTLYKDNTVIDESTIPVGGKQFNLLLGESTYKLVVYKPEWLTGYDSESVNITITKDSVTVKYDDKHVFKYGIQEIAGKTITIYMYKPPKIPPKTDIYINNTHVSPEALVTMNPGAMSLKIVVNDNAYVYKISYTIYRDKTVYDTGTESIYRLSQIDNPVTAEFTTKELESGSYTLRVTVDSIVDTTYDLKLNVIVEPELWLRGYQMIFILYMMGLYQNSYPVVLLKWFQMMIIHRDITYLTTLYIKTHIQLQYVCCMIVHVTIMLV